MRSPFQQDRLEIEVQDFGPIVHAKLDLRPMTVFIGPSNTGKSYLAILLYALHRFCGSGSRSLGPVRFGPWRSQLGSNIPDPTPENINAFAQLARSLDDISPWSEGESTVVGLPGAIVNLLRSEFDKLAGNISSEILRCFGMNTTTALVRKGHANRARVSIRGADSHGGTLLEQNLSLNNGNTVELKTTVPNHIEFPHIDMRQTYLHFALQDIRTISEQADGDTWANGYLNSMLALMDLVLPRMVADLGLRAFYLPADRTGVVHAHGGLVSAMIDRVPLAGLEPVGHIPLFSGVFGDFLSQLIQVDRVQRETDAVSHVAGQDVSRGLEQNILRGTIGVERSELINYPHFTYRPDGWKEDLSLMHASSMVSDLAPIVLYLRHLALPGNVLIIEEPESHLHPAMQVEFTRQLAKLVQAGYRVIITTHSEWILEELANVVQRSQLPPEEISTVSVSNAALTADQVGVWLFRPKARPRGSEVVQITLDDSGLYPSDFDDVAMALGNDSAKIFNRIGE